MTEQSGKKHKEQFARVGVDEQASENLVRPSISYWQDAFRRLKKNKVAMASLILLLIIVFMCIFAPYIYPHPYDEQNIEFTNQGPTLQHIFGLDDLGRDIFARIWIGGRVSLTIGVVGALVSLLIGVLYGGISGYLGGLVDDIMMRILEILSGIPYMVMVIIVTVFLGKGMSSLLLALCITSWTGLARLVRGQVLELKKRAGYVMALQSAGHPTLKDCHQTSDSQYHEYHHRTRFSIPSFIFSEAFLSFIGMGIQPPLTQLRHHKLLGQQQMAYSS